MTNNDIYVAVRRRSARLLSPHCVLLTEKLSPSAETELQIVISRNNNKSFNISNINSISAPLHEISGLTRFAGTYYAMWSSGWRHEDDVGQRVMVSRSFDFETWSKPLMLIPTARGKHSDLVRYAEGWHQHAGTLVAYYAQCEYEPDVIKAQSIVTHV